MGSFPAVNLSLMPTGQVMRPESLLSLLGVEQCAVEYQPIVSLREERVYAYEALARFYGKRGESVSPLTVFQALHSNPALLGRTEFQLKWHQIASAPQDVRLFINLDPHALTEEVQDSLMSLLTRQNNLVVELIENTDLQDSKASLALYQALRDKGVCCALDDVGTQESLLSIDLMVAVEYLKFDRRWLGLLDRPEYERLFRHLLEFARACGRKTILEGVETAAQRQRMQDYPLDYIQGFLYRDRFIQSTRCNLYDR